MCLTRVNLTGFRALIAASPPREKLVVLLLQKFNLKVRGRGRGQNATVRKPYNSKAQAELKSRSKRHPPLSNKIRQL